MKRLLVLTAIIFIFSVLSVYSAEKPYSIHLHPYGGYWMGGDRLKDYEYLGQAPVYGVRLGFAFSEHFVVEAGYEFSPNEFPGSEIVDEGDADIRLYYANVLAHMYNSRKFCPYAIAGVGQMDIDSDIYIEEPETPAFMLGVGVIYYFMENVGIRAELRDVIIEESPDNMVFTTGLEFRFLGGWKTKKKEPGRKFDSDRDGVTDDVDKCPGTVHGCIVDGNGCPMDTDSDGVPDGIDKCPNTTRGASVNDKGCSSDADNDGVQDGIDACPDTPAGAKVDAKGCPLDSDGDGVYDGLDNCPGTPAGASVNTVGCAGDADNDGVKDGIDKCPDTPAGAKVDASGCPLDGDKDGVYDGLDACPQTPTGMKVDLQGCTADADGDTVPDTNDHCPNTPTGTPVDVTGCPEAAEADTDADGVSDSNDKCPNTMPGVDVDEVGCQILEKQLVIKGITFRTGSARIQPQSMKELDSVVEVLKAHPDMKIEIQGYTDSTGSERANLRLSTARARSVYRHLIRVGIARQRLSYKGYGPANPIASNDTDEGRALNRRIEFKIIEGGK